MYLYVGYGDSEGGVIARPSVSGLTLLPFCPQSLKVPGTIEFRMLLVPRKLATRLDWIPKLNYCPSKGNLAISFKSMFSP